MRSQWWRHYQDGKESGRSMPGKWQLRCREEPHRTGDRNGKTTTFMSKPTCVAPENREYETANDGKWAWKNMVRIIVIVDYLFLTQSKTNDINGTPNSDCNSLHFVCFEILTSTCSLYHYSKLYFVRLWWHVHGLLGQYLFVLVFIWQCNNVWLFIVLRASQYIDNSTPSYSMYLYRWYLHF